jgi:hypothetical protein
VFHSGRRHFYATRVLGWGVGWAVDAGGVGLGERSASHLRARPTFTELFLKQHHIIPHMLLKRTPPPPLPAACFILAARLFQVWPRVLRPAQGHPGVRPRERNLARCRQRRRPAPGRNGEEGARSRRSPTRRNAALLTFLSSDIPSRARVLYLGLLRKALTPPFISFF